MEKSDKLNEGSKAFTEIEDSIITHYTSVMRVLGKKILDTITSSVKDISDCSIEIAKDGTIDLTATDKANRPLAMAARKHAGDDWDAFMQLVDKYHETMGISLTIKN